MGDESAGSLMLMPIAQLLSVGRPLAHPVLHAEGGLLCWGDFSAEVYKRTRYLQQHGAQRWLLACESTAEFAHWLLALLLSGKTIVLPPNAQSGTLAQLADAFEAVVTELNPQDWAKYAAQVAEYRLDAARIELYTSGSSGQPKRISKSLAQLECEVAVLEAVWGAQMGAASVIATVPHQHIYGLLFRVLWPLAAGRSFDCTVCAHPDTLQQRSAALGDTVLVASPAQLSRLSALMDLPAWANRPRLIFSSGGPLSAETAQQFKDQLGTAPTEIYGSTETGGMAWRNQALDERWQPLPGVHLESTSSGALLHSPFLGGAVSHVLDDAIELAADGRFRLLGRVDRVVKVEEKRLSLPELEQKLATHAWVEQAAAVVLSGRRQSVAVVVQLNAAGHAALAAQGRGAMRDALRVHLAAFYDAVLLPRYWRYVELLPYTAQGKLPQTALQALFQENEHVAS